jgi:uncharacterized protein (DUF2062 family)
MWDAAKKERASPRQIGVAVAIGAFACFAPVLWLHLATALLLATIFRVNRLWAAAASQLPSLFGLLRVPILFVELEVGRYVRTGAWLDLTPREAMKSAPHLLLDWVVGCATAGVLAASLLGIAAFAWARRRDRLAASAPAMPNDPPAPPGISGA